MERCTIQWPSGGIGIEQGDVQYSAEEDDLNDTIWEMFQGDVQYSAEEDDFIDIINELFQTIEV